MPKYKSLQLWALHKRFVSKKKLVILPTILTIGIQYATDVIMINVMLCWFILNDNLQFLLFLNFPKFFTLKTTGETSSSILTWHEPQALLDWSNVSVWKCRFLSLLQQNRLFFGQYVCIFKKKWVFQNEHF